MGIGRPRVLDSLIVFAVTGIVVPQMNKRNSVKKNMAILPSTVLPFLSNLFESVYRYSGRYRASRDGECYHCRGRTRLGEEVDLILIYDELNGVWHRMPACTTCAANIAKLSESMMRKIPTWNIEQSRMFQRDRSARVLLLLEEAGLCRDVAWVIAGIACWLL